MIIDLGYIRIRVRMVDGLILSAIKDGPIISLDEFAHKNDLTPWRVRECAHQAAQEGRLKLTRLSNRRGRPYRVEAGPVVEEEK